MSHGIYKYLQANKQFYGVYSLTSLKIYCMDVAMHILRNNMIIFINVAKR